MNIYERRGDAAVKTECKCLRLSYFFIGATTIEFITQKGRIKSFPGRNSQSSVETATTVPQFYVEKPVE